ncbi:MAG: hypothetical protein ACE5GY_06350 [Thermodesulfobacteriota bacterium]
MGLILTGGLASNAYAEVQLPPQESIDSSKRDVEAIVAFYGKLQDALNKKDLAAIMSFYADDYNRQGITKNTIRNLWKNIFNNFDHLNSTHIFSSVVVKDKDAAITCTGMLLGIPKASKDKNYEQIDKWANMGHFLAKRNGKWQIIGGASHWLVQPKLKGYGRIEKYELEFHPLF